MKLGRKVGLSDQSLGILPRHVFTLPRSIVVQVGSEIEMLSEIKVKPLSNDSLKGMLSDKFGPIKVTRMSQSSLSSQSSYQDPVQCYSMLTARPWACLPRFVLTSICRSWCAPRYQSTNPTPASTISPALLGRARALAAEHAKLVKQLDREYDNRVAKKAGSILPVATALNDWESVSRVRPQSARQTHCY